MLDVRGNGPIQMLKLYTAHNSICTQKVFITLAEKGQAYTTHIIDLFRNEQYSDWYLAINPRGIVPALEHDGRHVIESSLICEYIDEVFTAVPLMPKAPFDRARARLWSKTVDEEIFEATRELSFSAMFREKMRGMTEEQRQGRFRNVGCPIKRARLMSTYEKGVESEYVFQGIASYERAFARMEQDLSAEAWLVGPTMTLADINMIPFVARLAYLDLLDVWLAARPRTRAWWNKVEQLASVKASIAAKLTADDIATMKRFGGEIRPRVAERRQEYLQLMA